jgi:hypothetical protein
MQDCLVTFKSTNKGAVMKQKEKDALIKNIEAQIVQQKSCKDQESYWVANHGHNLYEVMKNIKSLNDQLEAVKAVEVDEEEDDE